MFFFIRVRFKLDGIKHYKDVQERNGILPFGQSGRQSIKYKLIKEMVPGKPELFPFDALTAIERCTLHQAISNTIMKEDSYGTSKLCEEIGQKLISKAFLFASTLYLYKGFRIKINCDLGRVLFANPWNCPREYGVILTSYGTIAPGAIIGAIAASLQHQNIGLRQIVDTIPFGIIFIIKYFRNLQNLSFQANCSMITFWQQICSDIITNLVPSISALRHFQNLDIMQNNRKYKNFKYIFKQCLFSFVLEKPTTIASVTHIEEVDFIVPRNEMIHDRSMSYLSSLEPNLKLDNVWLTTIAGGEF